MMEKPRLLHVDGYPGYHKVAKLKLVGCWAHARRKFDEALRAAPPETRSNPESASVQERAFCNKLFALERGWTEATPKSAKQHVKPTASRW